MSLSRRRLATLTVLALGALAVACRDRVAEPSGRVDSPSTAAGTSAEVARLADELWQRQLERSALLRVRQGLPVERLDDLGYPAAAEDARFAALLLERVEAIDPEALGESERLTLEVLRWDLGIAVEGLEWFWHESVLTPYSAPLAQLRPLFAAQPLGSGEEVDAYLALLDQVPGFVDALRRRVEGQVERGIQVPRPALPACVALVRAFAAAPESGPFDPAEARLSALDPADQERLRAGIATRVEAEVNPRLAALADWLEGEYAQSAPEGVGARQWPRGEEFYRFAVRRSTTTGIAPEEIHRIGLEMVAELEAAMAAVREEIGFQGTREEFHASLRQDPRFFPTTAEEVGERLARGGRDFEAVVDRFFGARPRAGWEVRRLDPALEGSQTYGYYDPPKPADPVGVYYFNGSRLDQRSWIGLEAIALHELVPGHHFHIARQQENDSLPALRRNAFHGAYTEGWGSYASMLGLEAGLYRDPYSRYGMYVLEIFLASRLVVDTGMNLLGWSLEEGRAYQRQHTLESETQIATESLRYSTDIPAQALAYQMGKRRLIELRSGAEGELGERFDLRGFHETVLAPGSLPLAVLDGHVERWVERSRGEVGG